MLTDLVSTDQLHIESECIILACNSTQSPQAATTAGFTRFNSSCFEGEVNNYQKLL